MPGSFAATIVASLYFAFIIATTPIAFVVPISQVFHQKITTSFIIFRSLMVISLEHHHRSLCALLIILWSLTMHWLAIEGDAHLPRSIIIVMGKHRPRTQLYQLTPLTALTAGLLSLRCFTFHSFAKLLAYWFRSQQHHLNVIITCKLHLNLDLAYLEKPFNTFH